MLFYSDRVVVKNTKKEQCVNGRFEFQWQLTFTFAISPFDVRDISLKVSSNRPLHLFSFVKVNDLVFSDTISKKESKEIYDLLKR